MEEEDYFGNVTVPLDEEEEDAANDLTFGDTSDIKAGDDSDAAWNPTHQTLSSKLEAEKEVLYRSRQSAQSHAEAHPSLHAHEAPSNRSRADHSSPLQQQGGNGVSPWEMLKQSMLQSSHQTLTQPSQPTELGALRQPLQTSPPHLPQSLPLPTQQPPALQSVPPPVPRAMPQLGSQAAPQLLRQPVHPQVQLQQHVEHAASQAYSSQHAGRQPSPPEYHHYLVSLQQQQTNILLQQHQEQCKKQLMEAERAQQAGIPFDRKKFDHHQAAMRQMILSDHYNRMRQVQYQALQYQQLLAQTVKRTPERTPERVPGVNIQRTMDGNSLPNSKIQLPGERGVGISQQTRPHATNGGHTVDVFRTVNADPRDPHSLRDPREPRESRGRPLSNGTRVRHLRDEDLENDPRMLEIERQMAAAGLGPAGGKARRSDEAFRASAEGIQNGSSPQDSRTKRRLQSMTDKDQELVFRAHLRQIETSVVYRDDFYNSILKSSEKDGGDEIFAKLSERVRSMRLRGKERSGTRAIRVRGSKRGNANTNSDDHYQGSSPPHSDHNMRALANALGTVQSWNPRAPRRVMDFSLLEKKDASEEGGPHKLLREDERVHVRQEIERGYDVIATIHDIARGENQVQTLGQSAGALMSTLHLADKQEEGQDNQREHHESTRFFATMCIIPKGRRYLALVLELLDTADKVRVMSATFENLGMLVFASKKAQGSDSVDGSSQLNLFTVMTNILQGTDLVTADCMHLFDAFCSCHVPHRDAFLTTFRSSLGARLIFLCMQRISAGMTTQTVGEGSLSLSHIGLFVETFTQSLQDIFDGAESESRVWEVVASLDALASGDVRTGFRSELNRLLRAGAVPQPPAR